MYSSLVPKFLAQVEKRPATEGCPLRLSSLDPFADARQLFDGNPSFGAFSLGNNPFGSFGI
jgi:hypothetical protein